MSDPTHDTTISVVANAPVSLTPELTLPRGHQGAQFFAGIRSDPFFFDLLGFFEWI